MQIALGVRHISFRFDEDVGISVKGEFSYFDGQAEWWDREQNPAQMANRTVSLVGATIQNFVAHEDGTLILTFSNVLTSLSPYIVSWKPASFMAFCASGFFMNCSQTKPVR